MDPVQFISLLQIISSFSLFSVSSRLQKDRRIGDYSIGILYSFLQLFRKGIMTPTMDSAIQGSLETFDKFPLLPPEFRDQIWGFSSLGAESSHYRHTLARVPKMHRQITRNKGRIDCWARRHISSVGWEATEAGVFQSSCNTNNTSCLCRVKDGSTTGL